MTLAPPPVGISALCLHMLDASLLCCLADPRDRLPPFSFYRLGIRDSVTGLRFHRLYVVKGGLVPSNVCSSPTEPGPVLDAKDWAATRRGRAPALMKLTF